MPDLKTSPLRKRESAASRSTRVVTNLSNESMTQNLPDFGEPMSAGSRKTKGPGALKPGLIVFLVLVAVAGLAGYAYGNPGLFSSKPSQQKFHAVFLNGGQVYFGTIAKEDRESITLKNVFYVQFVDQTIPPAKEGDLPQTIKQPQLIKKGEEFYSPEDTIRINRDQVTVIEDLKEDSQIMTEIRARLQAPTPAP